LLESRQAVPIQRRYAYGLGSNNILSQMNVAPPRRAGPLTEIESG
jgi:hypothetical protein